jgi:copper(I)-binding protein
MVTATAAYMTLTSDANDKLISVTSHQASKVELHQSRMVNGMMSMRHVESIDIHQNETLALRPKGYHLMVKGLQKTLKEGERFTFTFLFETAGKIEVTAPVERR